MLHAQQKACPAQTKPRHNKSSAKSSAEAVSQHARNAPKQIILQLPVVVQLSGDLRCQPEEHFAHVCVKVVVSSCGRQHIIMRRGTVLLCVERNHQVQGDG